jgi:capsular polysaccharide biosynthesis protein
MDLFVDEKTSSLRVFKLLYKHFLMIVIFSFIGAVVALTVTFFIPKKYLSYAVVFPPNSNLGLNVLEDPRFGNSLDADQLMQVLESKQIKDTIIQMYSLEDYYDIDRSDKIWRQKLDKLFYRDVTFSKTRYYSIVISAEMKDPELAANIVNSIIEMVDVYREKIMRQNQQVVYNYAKNQYQKQVILVDSLKKNIYTRKGNLNSQNLLYNHLLENTKNDFYSSSAFVDSPEMENLVQSYNYEYLVLVELKGDFDKAERLIQKPFSKVFVVNKGVPNYKKNSPSFLTNILIGFFSSFFFIVLFIIARDRWANIIKELKQ